MSWLTLLKSFVSFLLSNLWRTAAIALTCVVLWQQHTQFQLNLDKKFLTVEIEHMSAQLEAVYGSAKGWETEARLAEARLATWVQKYEVDMQAERNATKESQQREADADASLKLWTQRYAESLRDDECRKLMETPICESLQ